MSEIHVKLYSELENVAADLNNMVYRDSKYFVYSGLLSHNLGRELLEELDFSLRDEMDM